jgi:hypothetical protein
VTFVVALAAPAVSADPLVDLLPRERRNDCALTGACCFPRPSPHRPLELAPSTPDVRAFIGVPVVEGGLSRPVVKRFVASHADELAACSTHRALASAGHARGGLSLAILPSGDVKLLAANGFDGEISACMARALASTPFPRACDITRAIVPIAIR